jgi:hypothetical protein
VRSVLGLSEARQIAGVDDVQVFAPVGGRILPLTDAAKRAAYALAHGTSRGEATARADAALGCIQIETGDDANTEQSA